MSLASHYAAEPKEVGTCCGCDREILEYQDRIDINGDLIHDDNDCIRSYVMVSGTLIEGE